MRAPRRCRRHCGSRYWLTVSSLILGGGAVVRAAVLERDVTRMQLRASFEQQLRMQRLKRLWLLFERLRQRAVALREHVLAAEQRLKAVEDAQRPFAEKLE